MKKKKILIVLSNYYSKISFNLLSNSVKFIKNYKKTTIEKTLITVPGVFEIPVVISRNIKKYDGFIALGCVIKGKTPHFNFISQSTTDAIMKLSIENKKPIGNGIITCLNKKQALVRSLKKGRESVDAVMSVLTH